MKKYSGWALILLVIGAFNYGVCSIFGINFIAYLAFGYEIIRNIIYFFIGFAGIVILYQKIAR